MVPVVAGDDFMGAPLSESDKLIILYSITFFSWHMTSQFSFPSMIHLFEQLEACLGSKIMSLKAMGEGDQLGNIFLAVQLARRVILPAIKTRVG